MFEAVEKLKSQYTDQYVVVDATRPELARFAGLTGQVKTVNMSHRALVQFDGRNNIGWFDIGLEFLKVVPKPEPKVEEKAAKKTPAAPKPQTSADHPAVAPDPVSAKAKPAPAASAAPVAEKVPPAAQAAAKEEPKPAAPAGEKKMSTADILAALRKKS